MKRRDFLKAGVSATLFSRLLSAGELPRDLRITRIVGFDLITRRSKLAGKNSHLDVHGDQSRDRMVRIFTNAGLEGLGNCRAAKESLARLLGQSPFEPDPASPRMNRVIGSQTMPLWDLAGKALKKPVHQLLGDKGRPRVSVYDGSIYFADLLPQYADRWQDRFRRELDMGLQRGHRGFKVKIGRGFKWMDRAAGDARDVEVLRIIREHAGKDVLVGADANNGYDLPGAKRFLEQAGRLDLAFLEEMFPEQLDACLDFKRSIAAGGYKTLLADGETQSELEPFKPYIRAKAMDVLQADMNHFGFEGILEEAQMARPQGILIAPHNWGSLVGFYMQLHVGRAIDNFYGAENDPLSSDVLIADGYKITDGACSVPDSPGFGLTIDETKFKDVKVNFDLRA
jgi:D-galactarolactone cycloisomerase